MNALANADATVDEGEVRPVPARNSSRAAITEWRSRRTCQRARRSVFFDTWGRCLDTGPGRKENREAKDTHSTLSERRGHFRTWVLDVGDFRGVSSSLEKCHEETYSVESARGHRGSGRHGRGAGR